MKCYFFGSNLTAEKSTRRHGVISFAIPDYGVLFRAQHEGDHYECEYGALLALVRFLQVNRQHFRGKQLTLLTDSAVVVYQGTRRIAASGKLARLRDLLLFYQRKLGFKLEWLPSRMNRANMDAEQSPVSSRSPKFNYDIFEETIEQKSRPLRRPPGRIRIV